MQGGWRSKASKAKLALAGTLAATMAWPGARASAAGLAEARGGDAGVHTVVGARGSLLDASSGIRSAGGRTVAFATPQGIMVAKGKQPAAAPPSPFGLSPGKVAGAGAALAGVAGVSAVARKASKGTGIDDFDEAEAAKPHPLFEAFDECDNLKMDELRLSAWEGRILDCPEGSQMHGKQRLAKGLAKVSGWYGKTFGADDDCQALVIKTGPFRYGAPFGLGDCTYSHDGYRQRWSTVMRTSVAVEYKNGVPVTDYIRRVDEDTLMGVAVRGKEPLVYFELKRLKE